jgi:3-hydroxyacyl-CoA dehydrogenase
MFWASTIGLDKVLAGLQRHAAAMPDVTLSPLLRSKAERGEAFDG